MKKDVVRVWSRYTPLRLARRCSTDAGREAQDLSCYLAASNGKHQVSVLLSEQNTCTGQRKGLRGIMKAQIG